MQEPINAAKIAEYLLQIKAIKLQPNEPFTWASGWKSPIYCDNRVSLSFPAIRTDIKHALAAKIKEMFPDAEAIVGVATAGIPQGALVADAMNLPAAYVRPEPKSHGRQNQLEGDLPAGCKVVVLEDLISTGKSSLKAVEVLRSMGLEVIGLAAIFTYGFPVAEENFKQAACPWFALSDYNVLIETAIETGYVAREDAAKLAEWRKAPEVWGN
ncbi:MAG: orotate phosphoribosyltransferase [Bacteroidota bacterium]|nr:orotate phosphoribosyltransferase [Bacteroidota bacterium]MDX5429486.1 orotate phosphoribosyltransferase [Bacteroidota bacterium]MDX5468273.1 orotate phosphoribosyltransferase [Bacteroidota bacterium]